MHARVSIVTGDGGTRVVVAGEIDAGNVGLLREALRPCGAAGRVEVDLSEVTWLTCAGAGVLAAATAVAGRRLSVVGELSYPVRRVLELVAAHIDVTGSPAH